MSNGEISGGWNVYTIFKVIAYGIPALLIAFGAYFVFSRHTIDPFGLKRIIPDGSYLIIIGLAIYFMEIGFLYF
jgi:hypothetical protein